MMIVSQEHLKVCIQQANLIHQAYGLDWNEPHTARSVPGLLKVIEKMTGSTIDVYEVDVDGDLDVRGMCLLLPDNKVEIALASGLNRCWERFVITKELFHVALERDEYRTTDLFEHIEEYTATFPVDSSKPSLPVIAEFLAEVGALELLFPYADRKMVLAGEAPKNYLEIATRYLIPKVLAERYLSHSYMEALAHFGR